MVKIIVDICRPLFSRGVLPLGCGKCTKHCIAIGPPKKEYTCNILLYIYAKLRICNRRQYKTFEFWSRSMKNLWVLISVGWLKGKSKPVFPLFSPSNFGAFGFHFPWKSWNIIKPTQWWLPLVTHFWHSDLPLRCTGPVGTALTWPWRSYAAPERWKSRLGQAKNCQEVCY